MKIEINQDDVEMTITKSTPLTSELFEVYIKHFNRSNKYGKPLCEDCKQEIEPGRKYCDDCKKKRKQKQVNDWNKRNPDKNREYQEKKTIRKKLREGREISNESKTLKTQMFNDNERLAKIGDKCGSGKRYNNPIYKPVLDYITEHCGIPVNKGELAILIREFYEKKGRMITRGTALLYANDYQKHINEESKAHDTIKKELCTPETRIKAPDNTALFFNWLESNHITKFETTDFVDAYASMNMEAAEKIISHQIHKNIITQLGNNSFKVNWTKLEEENDAAEKS